jgi:flagellar hook-length control protein FliK
MINGFPLTAPSTQPQVLGAPLAGHNADSEPDATDLSFLGILMQVVAAAAPRETDIAQAEPPAGEAGTGDTSGKPAAAGPTQQNPGTETVVQTFTGSVAAAADKVVPFIVPVLSRIPPAVTGGMQKTGEQGSPSTPPPVASTVPEAGTQAMKDLLTMLQPVVDGEQMSLPLTAGEAGPQPEVQKPATANPEQDAPVRHVAASENLIPEVMTAAMAVSSEVRQAGDEISPRTRAGVRVVPTGKEAIPTKTLPPVSMSRAGNAVVAETIRLVNEQTRPAPAIREEHPGNTPAPQGDRAQPVQESVVTLLRAVEKGVPAMMMYRESPTVKSVPATSPLPESVDAAPLTSPGELPLMQEASRPMPPATTDNTGTDQRQKEASSASPQISPVRDEEQPADAAPSSPQMPVAPSKPTVVNDQPPLRTESTPERTPSVKSVDENSKPGHRDEPTAPSRTTESSQGMFQMAQKGVHELQKGQAMGLTNTEPVGKETPAGLHATSVIDQIAKSLASSVQSGSQEVRLELHPKELGSVTLKVMVEQNGVAAQIDVKDPAVKTVLENNLPQLREAFQREQLEVNRVEIVLTSEGTPQESTRQWGGKHPNGRSGEELDDNATRQESSRSLGYNTMELTM